jgi:nucleoside 2-deoxyribosyltransferase
MKIFIAASYSSRVDYVSGRVFPDYKIWLEDLLVSLERSGHTVFCALRADNYTINTANPVAAFRLDAKEIEQCDILLAFIDNNVSAGVQLEIGYALALKKNIVLAHLPKHSLPYINSAIVHASLATEVLLPFTDETIRSAL